MQNESQEDPKEVAAALPEKLIGKVSYRYACKEKAPIISLHDHDRTIVKFKIYDMTLIRTILCPVVKKED